VTTILRVDTMEIEKVSEGGRRGAYVRRSAELKAAIVAESLPLASGAPVALAHGVNANLVRKWIEKSHAAARERHPTRWSGPTCDWSPIGAVTLNPEQDAVIAAAAGEANKQPLAA
jgi:transposase-like protein